MAYNEVQAELESLQSGTASISNKASEAPLYVDTASQNATKAEQYRQQTEAGLIPLTHAEIDAAFPDL